MMGKQKSENNVKKTGQVRLSRAWYSNSMVLKSGSWDPMAVIQVIKDIQRAFAYIGSMYQY